MMQRIGHIAMYGSRSGGVVRLVLLALVLSMALGVSAQRRITPVQPTTPGTVPNVEREKRIDRTHLVEQTDANGNTIFVDTVTGREVVDSLLLPAPPKMEYPLLHELIGGVNLWNPLMRAFGQHYGLSDVWAEVSLHNRYFPFLAIGVDNCNDTPDGSNFTFRVPVSPYFKIGASYNFFYNSNPDYKLQMGFRYGFTTYKWNVEDITVNEGYWNDPTHFALLDQKSTAGYLEITFGLKVKVFRSWSLGWNIIYHSILHETKNPSGKPMFIPGYGKRGSAVTGSFSLMYTIPFDKLRKNKPVVINNTDIEDVNDI
ncbi:MAG: DUF6048 family protein [Bacteroides sp.]|nr:DUF6048 family protein [Bacteroides sp.]